ncbi:MAG: regulatory protein RecX [Propioniciclava sp.]
MGADDAHADPVGVARDIVLRQLTARARTRSELEQALARKGVPEDVADEVLDRFTELRLIDDVGYAAAWVEGQQRRMTSRRALRQELGRKGVEAEVIDEALEGVDDETEFAAALALAEKRARATRGLERQVRYRRMAGALARKGFSGAITHRAVQAALQDSPDDGPSLDDLEVDGGGGCWLR